MPSDTLVAMFDTASHAEAAVADLLKAGVPSGSIETHSEDYEQADQLPSTQPSVTSRGGFWSWLGSDQGADQHLTHSGIYDRTIASGRTAVAVAGDDIQLEKALLILEEHSPIDIEERLSPPAADI